MERNFGAWPLEQHQGFPAQKLLISLFCPLAIYPPAFSHIC